MIKRSLRLRMVDERRFLASGVNMNLEFGNWGLGIGNWGMGNGEWGIGELGTLRLWLRHAGYRSVQVGGWTIGDYLNYIQS